MPDHIGKFSPTYKGLYVVKKAFSRGALILANIDGLDFNLHERSLVVHLIFM